MADSGRIVARAVDERAWRLGPRSPTLGGNVPLRAARSCPPFLLGNSFGLQLSPREPIRIRRGLRSLEVSPRPVHARAKSSREIEVVFDTGLELRGDERVVLEVERAFNRRDRRVSIAPARVVEGDRLSITIRVALARGESADVEGEVATISPFAVDPPLVGRSLAAATSVAEAHLEFFDQAYFSEKRRGPTNKYKKRALAGGDGTDVGLDDIVVVQAGGAPPRFERDDAGAMTVTLPVEADIAIVHHGQRVEASYDAATMARRARSIEHAFENFGAASTSGAVRYFTTYVTPHAPGDPHVFFKPAVLVAAPPGWAAVIDGPEAPGLEGLRGVTEPDWFHAIPAVVEVVAPEARLRAGNRLVRVRFTPRGMVNPELEWLRAP